MLYSYKYTDQNVLSRKASVIYPIWIVNNNVQSIKHIHKL